MPNFPQENLPDPGFFVDDATVNLFKTSMDQLLSDMGEKFTLKLEPQKENCPNCGWDRVGQRSNNRYSIGGPKPFANGQTCPWCNGKGQLYTHQEIQYTAIMDPSKKGVDKALEELGFAATENALRTITVIESFEAIKAAHSASIRREEYKLLAGPVILGLRDQQFVDTIWQKVARK